MLIANIIHELKDTSANICVHQVRRAGFFLLRPSVMELSPCRTTHYL